MCSQPLATVHFLSPHNLKKLNQCYPQWDPTVREELFGAENQPGFIPQTSAFVGHVGTCNLSTWENKEVSKFQISLNYVTISPAWVIEQGRLSLKPCLKNSELKSVQFNIPHKLLLCCLQTPEGLAMLSPNTFQYLQRKASTIQPSDHCVLST